LSVTLILARAKNGVIGKDGLIPWRIPEDLKRFKALTLGKAVIMGRKTWESLPKKPLPERRNIVVTRQQDWKDAGAETMPLKDTLALENAMVIGGAEIYRAALPAADRIELTEVHRVFDGDAIFEFDRSGWREIAREDHVTPDGLGYSFVTLIRQ
jgi:dihydrofolate reductase